MKQRWASIPMQNPWSAYQLDTRHTTRMRADPSTPVVALLWLTGQGYMGYILEETIKQDAGYLQAYRDFRESVDFTKGGFLPDLDNLVWYLLIGVPPVPADSDPSEEGQIVALDQRLNILKAVFVELNRNMPDPFLDQGLNIYDQAGESARNMLQSLSTPEAVTPLKQDSRPEERTVPGIKNKA